MKTGSTLETPLVPRCTWPPRRSAISISQPLVEVRLLLVNVLPAAEVTIHVRLHGDQVNGSSAGEPWKRPLDLHSSSAERVRVSALQQRSNTEALRGVKGQREKA